MFACDKQNHHRKPTLQKKTMERSCSLSSSWRSSFGLTCSSCRQSLSSCGLLCFSSCCLCRACRDRPAPRAAASPARPVARPPCPLACPPRPVACPPCPAARPAVGPVACPAGPCSQPQPGPGPDCWLDIEFKSKAVLDCRAQMSPLLNHREEINCLDKITWQKRSAHEPAGFAWRINLASK